MSRKGNACIGRLCPQCQTLVVALLSAIAIFLLGGAIFIQQMATLHRDFALNPRPSLPTSKGDGGGSNGGSSSFTGCRRDAVLQRRGLQHPTSFVP